MPPKTKAALFDIAHAALGVAEFVNEKTLFDYRQDLMLRSAVERQLGIIGEAMTRLRKHDRDVAQRITDHEGIIAFKNLLVHGYDQIDDERVWEIIQQKLPILAKEVESLLDE